MLKKLTVTMAILCCFCLRASAETISNNFFSFTMPDDIKGTYTVDKFDNGIYIIEKISEKAGLIGFAFGLKIFRTPEDYVTFDGFKKIGELTAKNGIIYDMVLVRPSEVELAEGEEVQKNYDRLYEVGNNVEIKGINGSKYVKGKGLKGEELYKGIIQKYKKAFKENWGFKKYENENMGYAYLNLKEAKPDTDLMKEIGYAYYDINNDGIEELIIGPTDKEKNGYIYDIYTMKNRNPLHVVSGGDLDKHFVCNDYFICKQYSINGTENILDVFFLERNSKKMTPQLSLKSDSDKKAKIKWTESYGTPYIWGPISKKVYKNTLKNYTKDYKKFDFVPFSN